MLLDMIGRQSNVKSQSELNVLVAGERVRAERYGSKFSLLSFRSTDRVMSKRQQRLLTGAVTRRLRATDHVGWAQGGSLVVVLPETDEAGAQRVARDVFARLSTAGESISLSIEHDAR
jgi:hypothetical protein